MANAVLNWDNNSLYHLRHCEYPYLFYFRILQMTHFPSALMQSSSILLTLRYLTGFKTRKYLTSIIRPGPLRPQVHITLHFKILSVCIRCWNKCMVVSPLLFMFSLLFINIVADLSLKEVCLLQLIFFLILISTMCILVRGIGFFKDSNFELELQILNCPAIFNLTYSSP